MATVKHGQEQAQAAGELPTVALEALNRLLGDAGLITDPDRLLPRLTEWRGLFVGRAPAMLLPATTAEAAEAVRICAANGIGMVPQGGNTGLVGAAIPASTPGRPQVILGTSRLKRIRALDPDNFTITAEAGCVLADLQAAAADADRLFPLSLAAEGSCQLGGNISSNAGGINVLRFGNTRDLVLGLEVVLPDGRLFEGLRGLRKDNTGYDLKQLFIGAEGTLGLVTAATCKLFPRPRSTATAFLALADPQAAVSLYAAARERLDDGLVAFELLNRLSLDLVCAHIAGCRDPLGANYPWYVLMELATANAHAERQLENFLADRLDAGAVVDGSLAHSEQQRGEFWRIRHTISEAQKLAGAGIKHDISVPVSRVPEFIVRAGDEARTRVPGVQLVAFGHLGDGNIHFNLNQPPGSDPKAFLELWGPVSRAVHEIANDLGGSFSAEHGVGVLKRDELRRFRGGVEYALMQTLKEALDPAGLMNPGKLFGTAD